jgi:hypothetical protein
MPGSSQDHLQDGEWPIRELWLPSSRRLLQQQQTAPAHQTTMVHMRTFPPRCLSSSLTRVSMKCCIHALLWDAGMRMPATSRSVLIHACRPHAVLTAPTAHPSFLKVKAQSYAAISAVCRSWRAAVKETPIGGQEKGSTLPQIMLNHANAKMLQGCAFQQLFLCLRETGFAA